jgi:DNA-directed RNA polymerase subunit E'/Rpb7
MISMKIHLKMSEVGDSTKQNLERKIVQRTGGKCISEGYVRPNSVSLITYSSGVIKMNMIEFQVVFECLICNPVEGMIVECSTRTITKAGIHAEVVDDKGFLPMKIFVARDHNYNNRMFGTIKENMNIKVRIIGKRYELNDPYIVAIASLDDLSKDRGYIQKPGVPQSKIVVSPDFIDSDEEDAAVEEIETGLPEEGDGAGAQEEGALRNVAQEEGAPISLPTARLPGSPEDGEITE